VDILGNIIMSLLGGAAGQAGTHLYTRLKQFFSDHFRDETDKKVIDALVSIGNLSDSDIRKRVDELARLKKLPTVEAEELTALLINLAHGTRFHTTHGTLRSSFVRCETLLDQLLTCVLPKRRKGEPVAENGMPDWKLERFLGMGSFGEVWEARSPAYPESRAVKFFTNPDSMQWIRAEQQTLFHVKQQLPSHPNLVSFIDVGLTGKPFPYLVLEYASGGSMEDWILSHESDRPALDRRILIEGVIRGLAEAHEHGIAHRDLKPANILLAESGGTVLPKIADFGLGRVATQRAGSSALASRGGVVGTTIYLPPEALQPFVKRIPEQDDVFAVGVVWYQLLVGRLERPPYDFADRLREHLADTQTIRMIERCLAQPARRFKDAGELEQAVDLLPPLPIWEPPMDCFDVQHLAREYLASKV
jgi:eukaryotic-like serine/threonine-protein kinase